MVINKGSVEKSHSLSEEQSVHLKKNPLERVVKNLVEFWTWHSKVIEKKWKERN
jgi:hypothetical protein